MSTLIMSTGLFCSEPIFFDHQTSYFDNHNVKLYPSAYNTITAKENQISDFLDSREKNFNILRESYSNSSSPAALTSTEFMNSPYCQIEATPTPPLYSTTHSSLPTATTNTEATMTADVFSLLEQNWTSDSFTNVPTGLAHENDHISRKDKRLNRASDETVIPMSQSFSSKLVSSHQSMDTTVAENKTENILSDLLSADSLSVSSKEVNTQLAFTAETFDLADDISQQPFDIDNYLFSPMTEPPPYPTCSAETFNDPSNQSSQSHLHQPKQMQQNFPVQQQSSSMQSTSYLFPFDEPSFGNKLHVSRSDLTTDELDFDLGIKSFSSPESTVNKQYRHHSFTEGFCRTNLTPPLPQPSERLSIQNVPVELSRSTQQWYKNYGKFEKINPSVSTNVGSDVVSPSQFKKRVCYGTEAGNLEQKTASDPSDISFGCLNPSINLGTLPSKKLATDDLQTRSTSIISSSYTHNKKEIQGYYSPQNSPTRIDQTRNQNMIDFELYSKSQQQHIPQQSKVTNCHLLDCQFSEVDKTVKSTGNYPSRFTVSPPFVGIQSSGSTSKQFTKPQVKSKSSDCSIFNPQRRSSQSAICYQLQKTKAYSSHQRRPQYSPYSSQAKGGTCSRRSSKIINEGLCAVCGDNAACQHYGVRTCEGCKGFFKRTVQKKSTYVCLANKNCPVDKRRRNRCQFCRFEKCLAVGMVKEVVRTDELKGRRGRLPSKAKSPKDPVAFQSPPVSFITSLVRAHIDTNPAPSTSDASQYHGSGLQPSSSLRSIQEEAHYFYELLAACLLVLRQWAEKIPGFSTLTQEDQNNLIESSFLEIFVMRLSYRYEVQDGRLVFCNGTALHRDQLFPSFGDWSEKLIAFGCRLSDLNVDISSFSCMLALLLFQDRPRLQERHKVEKMRGLVIESLKEHIGKSPVTADRPNFFMNILAFMPDITKLASCGAGRLYQHKADFPSLRFPQCLQRTLNVFINQQ